MKGYESHQSVKAFLDQVCAEVKARDIHNEIRLELVSHIAEIVEEQRSEGVEEEAAIQLAIRQMGEPQLVGRQLHQVHKPKVEWGLFGLLVLFIGLGIMAMYAVQLSDQFGDLSVEKIGFSVLGIALMLLCYFANYRKLKPFSWFFYLGAIVMLVYLCVSSLGMKEAPSIWWSIGSLDILYTVSTSIPIIVPYLFMIAIAGCLPSIQRQRYGIWINTTLFILLPSCLYIGSHLYYQLVLSFLGFMVVVLISRPNWKEVTLYLGSFALLVGVALANAKPYLIERFTVFLHPYEDPLRTGYQNIQSLIAIRSAGFWGHGFGAHIDETASVPVIHTDFIFTYLVYSLGWVMGAILLVAVAVFCVRVAGVARKAADPYGKMLAAGFLAIISVSFSWNILSAVSMMPLSDIPFPFISHGGMHLLVELVATGIILSVYRRKDMIPKKVVGQKEYR